jgi:hypothetical protein
MNEIVITRKKILAEWETFRNRIFPPDEREKPWAQSPADWKNLPELERQRLPELNAFVQKILDSSEEEIPGIFDMHPTALKILLIFRVRRATDGLQAVLSADGMRVPAGGDPEKSLRNFFRHLMLQS